MLVCHCAVVNDQAVRSAIADGAHDLLDLASACGAGSFCGGCHPVLSSLLAQDTGETASALAATPSTVAGRPAEPRAVQVVVRALQEEILGSDLPEGAVIGPAADIARRHMTTPGTVRRAIRVLQHHGLVVAEPSGRIVTGPPERHAIAEAGVVHLTSSGVTVRELVDARRLIEVEAAHLAARHLRLHPGDDHHLGDALDARHGDDPLAWSADDDLHERIATITGNPVLEILVATVTRLARDQAAAALASGGDREGFGDTVARGHLALVAALRTRDPALAGEAMATHLDDVTAGLLEPHLQPGGVAAHVADGPLDEPADAIAVARRLATWIAREGLAPNTAIGTDHEVARALGVTRELLTEATGLLEYYAVATRPPGPRSHLVVCQADPWPVAELMALHVHHGGATVAAVHEALRPLELYAVGQAARHLDEDGGARLRRRLDEERVALGRDGLAGDPFRFSVSHNIHPLLAELSDNRVVALFASALHLALIRLAGGPTVVPASRRAGSPEELVDVHAEIVDAVLAGDADLAVSRMRDHVDAAGRAVRQDPGGPPG